MANGIKLVNSSSADLPIREGRQATGTLGAINAEVVLAVNGDDSALVWVLGTSPVLTVVFEGSVDGVNYFPLTAMPGHAVGGTIPSFAQQINLELYAATVTQRCYQVRTSQLALFRVRASTYTSGQASVTIRSDSTGPLLRNLDALTPVPLCVSTTGAASAAVTATLPAVAGMRHYLTNLQVIRSATAALTATATPVVVTSTNLPGALALTFGSDAGGIGVDREISYDWGTDGFAATSPGVATTIVCPVYTGVVWRVNAFYRLGV